MRRTPRTSSRSPQQHTEILRLAFTPYLADPTFAPWNAPYSVWITYRREADATKTTPRNAHVRSRCR
ncbi:hypothetical protein [Streptomyces sp. NPDC001537]